MAACNRCPGRHGTPPGRALRPGREELAVADPAQMPVREARDRSPKSPRWSAGRRASRVMGRKAPRQAPGLPRYVQAQRVPRKHPTTLGAPPPLDRGEAKRRSKTRAEKNAPRERRELSRMNWLKLTAAARRSNGASRPAACSARTRRRVRVVLPRTESLRAELAPCPQAAPG